MKRTDTDNQAAAFRSPVSSVEVAYETIGDKLVPAPVGRFAAAATPKRTEYGQWAVFRSMDGQSDWIDKLSAKAGIFYDPLLCAWINHPVYLKADHAILSSYNHATKATIHAERPTEGAFYGWHVLDRGMAVYEGAQANLTSLVAGKDVGIWVLTESSEDDGYIALRQQAPVARWGIISEPSTPLPVNPSFEIMLRMDDLQLGGDEPAVEDPSTAYVSIEFGQGAYRIMVQPRIDGGGSGKTKWTVALDMRTSGGWRELLGPSELDDLKPDSTGLLRIVVQCLEGRIVVRPDVYGEKGAVYTDRLPNQTVRHLVVPSGPLLVRGAYITCRLLVERILYAHHGWIVFPPIHPDYVSQSTQDLRVVVAGAEGVAEGRKPADRAPWLFTRMDYPSGRNAWATLGHGFDALQGFKRTDTLQLFVASPKQLDESTLLREIPPLQWAAEWGADDSSLLVALRMQAAEEIVGGWGMGSEAKAIMEAAGACTLVVRIVKLLWPPTLATTGRTWVPIACEARKGWEVSTSYNQDRIATASGTLTLGDRALPGSLGPLADRHGRRQYRFNVGWKNDSGVLWTTGHRYTLIGKGPSRGRGEGEVRLTDVLELAKDVTSNPPPDGELPSDYVAYLLLRSGIPPEWHELSHSARRIPAGTSDKPQGIFSGNAQDTAYDLIMGVAEWDEASVISAGEKIRYINPTAAPDAATVARAFAYSEGDGDGYRGYWPIQHAHMTEPEADDREVTRVVVVGQGEAGPIMAQARLVDRDREGDMAVVAGVGRRRDLVIVDSKITTQTHANAKARIHATRLWGDVGDYTVSIPSDPELRLFDVGTLQLHGHELAKDQWFEVVGISERVDAVGMPTMQVQCRKTNRYTGGGNT